MPFAADQQRHKVPVTIITGFLGAGKTTLLNYLLKQRGNQNLAVVENEFGEVDIDQALVADNVLEHEDLVSLGNGCVCCSLRKDIVKAFAEIERRSRQRNRNVDAILLETTGLADPAPVAFTFFANPWVASRFKLDSIMCVVDAKYLLQHLDDASKPRGAVNEVAQQLAFSDLILLNKVDLVTDEQKQIVIAAIRKINGTASLVECQLNDENRRPPIHKLLGVNSFSVNRALEVDPDFLNSDSDTEELPPDLISPRADGTDDSIDFTATAPSTAHHGTPSTTAAAPAAAEPATAAAATAHNHDSTATAAPHDDKACSASAAAAHTAGAADNAAAAPSTVEDAAAAAARSAPQGVSAAHAAEQDPPCPDGQHAGEKHRLEESTSGQHQHHDDSRSAAAQRQPKRRRKKLHDLSDVSSVGIVAVGTLDEYRFNMFMRDLLSEKAKDIFRCKGVLSLQGYGNQRFVFQGVHETICYGPADRPWNVGELRENKLVFIGRKLDRKALMEGFRSCIWAPLPDGWQEFRDPSSKKPYYFNPVTAEKSWSRPGQGRPYLVATHTSTEQPMAIQPRRPSAPVDNVALTC